jgi:hypothetical protein
MWVREKSPTGPADCQDLPVDGRHPVVRKMPRGRLQVAVAG